MKRKSLRYILAIIFSGVELNMTVPLLKRYIKPLVRIPLDSIPMSMPLNLPFRFIRPKKRWGIKRREPPCWTSILYKSMKRRTGKTDFINSLMKMQCTYFYKFAGTKLVKAEKQETNFNFTRYRNYIQNNVYFSPVVLLIRIRDPVPF